MRRRRSSNSAKSMMSKKPIDRSQTAGEVAAMLKEWLADRGKSIGGHTIEASRTGHGSGVGSGVFTRFSLGTPTPSSGKAPASGSSRTISVSDRDTKKLDEKSGAGGPEEEIGLAPLDEEDVLGVANRRPHEEAGRRLRQAGCFDERSGDVERHRVSGSKTGSKTGSKSGVGSGKARSLLEEELHDPEMEQMKRKMAQRAQFNPLQPPNYVPPSKGPSLGSVGGDRRGGRRRDRHRLGCLHWRHVVSVELQLNSQEFGCHVRLRILANSATGSSLADFCHSTASIRQLIPEPMPSMATRSSARSRPCSMPRAIVIGSAAEPVLPSVSSVAKSICGFEAQRFEHQLAMGDADLVAERAIDVVGFPTGGGQEAVERLHAGGDALPHQFFAVGLHDRFEAAALAEVVLARVAIGGRRRQPIAGLAQLFVAQHDRDAGRADRERRDRVFDRLARQRSCRR